MWIEIIDQAGKTLGAVNSETTDLIRVANNNPQDGAFVRSATAFVKNDAGELEGEVYKTRISYLRLIETLTQAEAEGLKQIAEIVADSKELTGDDRHRPRIVIP